MRQTSFLAVVLSSASALARLGETPLQFVSRHEPPKDTRSSKIYDKNAPVVASHPAIRRSDAATS